MVQQEVGGEAGCCGSSRGLLCCFICARGPTWSRGEGKTRGTCVGKGR